MQILDVHVDVETLATEKNSNNYRSASIFV